MLPRELELRRLWYGRMQDPVPEGYLAFRVRATCAMGAELVLARVREVLTIIFLQDTEGWPETARWFELLPPWFIRASASEEPDLQGWYDKWQSLPPEDRAAQEAADESKPWAISDFVYWFQPANRQWWWWASYLQSSEQLEILLMVEEPVVADDALEWLVRSAGADDVANENLLRLREDEDE